MSKLLVNGGKELFGEVNISGAKNAAVAIIPAAILADGVCRIENVPDIKDVEVVLDILKILGAKVNKIDSNTLEIDSRYLNSFIADCEEARKMRVSYYLMGALLGRMGRARVRLPGGCNFGERPIDQHIKGFEAMGADVTIDGCVVSAKAEHLAGESIYLDIVSVGATINIMLAACLADGKTIIENAAKEPHIVDVANFLNSMGAKIRGAGTDTIRIEGVEKMHGGTYSIIPDQIEAGTFMIAVAGCGGEVLVKNIIPKHMESLSAKLEEVGVQIKEFDDSILVSRKKDVPLRRANIKTMPYPGFPTDLQPQIVALLSMAEGTSTVTESVWESRFQYTEELKKMGADIVIGGNRAVIHGVKMLRGTEVMATDLRAGASLVISALMTEGQTFIGNLAFIERGYEKIEEKLTGLGADIRKVEG